VRDGRLSVSETTIIIHFKLLLCTDNIYSMCGMYKAWKITSEIMTALWLILKTVTRLKSVEKTE